LHGELGLGQALQDEVVAVLQRVMRNDVHAYRRWRTLGASTGVALLFAVFSVSLCTQWW
jgi:hypothetical protein